MFRTFSAVVVAFATIGVPVLGAQNSIEETRALVAKIRRADYEGDRAALARLYLQLKPLPDDNVRTAKVRYWRGFAMWRRALNGFNESVDATELVEDLRLAENEFEAVPPAYTISVEARIGAASCLANHAAVMYAREQLEQATELLNRSSALLLEIESQDPMNPRYLWVLGANRWYAPAANGGGQAAAIETYMKGLGAARRIPQATADSLDPTWGEAELLMNLAWSNLHKRAPDLKAAESYARAAIKLVPYWHYLRDMLLPQIRERTK